MFSTGEIYTFKNEERISSEIGHFKKNSQFSFFLAVTVGKVAEAIRAIQMMCRVPPESHHQLEAVMVPEVLEVLVAAQSPVYWLRPASLQSASWLTEFTLLTPHTDTVTGTDDW